MAATVWSPPILMTTALEGSRGQKPSERRRETMERAGCSQRELALGGEAAAGSRRDQERLGLVLVCFVLVFCFFFFSLSLSF